MRNREPKQALKLAIYIWSRGGIVPLDLYILCLQYGFNMERLHKCPPRNHT